MQRCLTTHVRLARTLHPRMAPTGGSGAGVPERESCVRRRLTGCACDGKALAIWSIYSSFLADDDGTVVCKHILRISTHTRPVVV
jgi:hypothetical protein